MSTEAVVRWLRPLVPLVMLVVIWAAFGAHPGPGHLPVAVALGVFAIGGVGAVVTLRRRGGVHAVFVAVVLAASVALVWLQPDGAGIAGIFVGVSLLAPLVRAHRSVPLVVALVVLAVVTGRHGSVITALLTAVMIGSFYGMMFLALRLADANERAGRLVAELEQSRAAQAEAAGLAERQRLAREMHDVLAHCLSGLMLQLEGARMLAADNPADPRLAQAINRAHQLGKTGLDEARRAIGTLRDDELPGPERLGTLAAQFEQHRGIPCVLTVTGAVVPLRPEARLALYRVAQEALTNVTKHADADRVELRLAYEPSGTRLTVEDFTGTQQASNGGATGYGLTGMRERAELLGGTLSTAATASGFRVQLDIPA